MDTSRRSILPLFKLSEAETDRLRAIVTADDFRTFAAEMAVKFGAMFNAITDRVWLDATESGKRAGAWVAMWEILADDSEMPDSFPVGVAAETAVISKSRFLAARYVYR